MPGSNDPTLTRYQEVLINRLALHYYLIGQVPVWLMIELENEGIDAQCLVDELVDQIEHIHTKQ
jgi:hypothetical protein